MSNECLLVFQPRNYECIAYLNNLRRRRARRKNYAPCMFCLTFATRMYIRMTEVAVGGGAEATVVEAGGGLTWSRRVYFRPTDHENTVLNEVSWCHLHIAINRKTLGHVFHRIS